MTAPSDQAIARCFERCFAATHPVRCIGGAQEPLYEPGGAGIPATLWYREDFAASALHEIAHWCLAGPQRRQRTDFGYLYLPPPRSAREQQRFLAYELRPQSLESLFAQCVGIDFQPSFDDVEDRHRALRSPFVSAIARERAQLRKAMPGRAARFAAALVQLRSLGSCR